MSYKFKRVTSMISTAPSIKEKDHQFFYRVGKRKYVLGTAFYKLSFASREIYFYWVRISVTNPKYMCFTNHDLY